MSELKVIDNTAASIAGCRSELLQRGWTVLPPHLLHDGARLPYAKFPRNPER